MKQTKRKINKLILSTTTILTLTVALGCSTNHKRDHRITQSLHKQNKLIQEVLTTKDLKKDQTSKALSAIQKSNEVIIEKLSSQPKKECDCGKVQRQSH